MEINTKYSADWANTKSYTYPRWIFFFSCVSSNCDNEIPLYFKCYWLHKNLLNTKKTITLIIYKKPLKIIWYQNCVFVGKAGGSVAIHSFEMSPECLPWAWRCSRSWDDLVKKIAVFFFFWLNSREETRNIHIAGLGGGGRAPWWGTLFWR